MEFINQLEDFHLSLVRLWKLLITVTIDVNVEKKTIIKTADNIFCYAYANCNNIVVIFVIIFEIL